MNIVTGFVHSAISIVAMGVFEAADCLQTLLATSKYLNNTKQSNNIYLENIIMQVYKI